VTLLGYGLVLFELRHRWLLRDASFEPGILFPTSEHEQLSPIREKLGIDPRQDFETVSSNNAAAALGTTAEVYRDKANE
jgi:hypothetical protein